MQVNAFVVANVTVLISQFHSTVDRGKESALGKVHLIEITPSTEGFA